MRAINLRDSEYDLEAGISKIIDQIYELISLFDSTMHFKQLSPHPQEVHLSTIRTLYLTGISLSDELENLITQTFTRYRLFNRALRKFTYSLRILSDLSEICDHLYEAHYALSQIIVTKTEYITLRDLWIGNLTMNLHKMLVQFMRVYSRPNLDLLQVDDDLLVISTLENECNRIFNEHTPSIIDMARSDLMDIGDAFYFTSVIRYLERAADIVYEMNLYAYNTHTSDLAYLFALKHPGSEDESTPQ